jgi:chromosome segregation ATPase
MSAQDDLKFAQERLAEHKKETEQLRVECESLRVQLKTEKAVAEVLRKDVARLDAERGAALGAQTRAEQVAAELQKKIGDAILAKDRAVRECESLRQLNNGLAKKCAEFGIAVA